jgi:single-strand DNA-binding protein
MFSMNKIEIIGRIGADAETKTINNDFAVTSFSVATTHSYKDKSGEWVNETTWHNVKISNCSDYIKGHLVKGVNIYVEGRLRKFDYEGKDGNKIYGCEIANAKVVLLEKQSSPAASNSEPTEAEPEDDDLPF